MASPSGVLRRLQVTCSTEMPVSCFKNELPAEIMNENECTVCSLGAKLNVGVALVSTDVNN